MYDFKPVAKGIQMIPIPVDGGSSSINVYILGPHDNAIIVDAGLESMAAELIATLEHNGIRPGGVAGIVVTHAHQDHYGAAGALADWSRAGVWAHPSAVSQMEDPADHFNARSQVISADPTREWEGFRAGQGKSIRVARLLREGDRIAHAGLDLQVLHTPGHDRTLITLYDQRLHCVLVGDLVQGGFDAAGTWLGLYTDPGAQRRSLKRILDLNPAILCKTHRMPRFGADVQADITSALQRLDSIDAALLDALAGTSPQPLGPLIRAAFKKVLNRNQASIPNYAAITVHAFLLDLARRGRIRQTPDLLWTMA